MLIRFDPEKKEQVAPFNVAFDTLVSFFFKVTLSKTLTVKIFSQN